MTTDFVYDPYKPRVVESVNGKSGVVTIKSSPSVTVGKTPDGHITLTAIPPAGGSADLSELEEKVEELEEKTTAPMTLGDDSPESPNVVLILKGSLVFNSIAENDTSTGYQGESQGDRKSTRLNSSHCT
jgi:hypothetical protein